MFKLIVTLLCEDRLCRPETLGNDKVLLAISFQSIVKCLVFIGH